MIRFMKGDGRKVSHAKLEEIRFSAVKAVQAGQSTSSVAREMELYTNRIFVWLAAYRSGGWNALRGRKASGRPKRLTAAQLKWIYNTVTTKNPLQLRFPFALWTRAMIQTLIRRKYGIKLSVVSVGRLLAQPRQPHHSVAYLRPGELATLQPLVARITTIVPTRFDGLRPPISIDRDRCEGAVRCIF